MNSGTSYGRPRTTRTVVFPVVVVPVAALPVLGVPVLPPLADLPLLLLLAVDVVTAPLVPALGVGLPGLPFLVEVVVGVPNVLPPASAPLVATVEAIASSSPLEPSPLSEESYPSSWVRDRLDAFDSFLAPTSLARPSDSAMPPSIAPATAPRRSNIRRLTESVSTATMLPLPTF